MASNRNERAGRLDAEQALAASNERAERLEAELKRQQANNRQRNIELDAVGYVWCSGGCATGTRRFTEGEITAEHVAAAMRNTERMLSNFVSRAGREDKSGTIAAREPLWEKAKRSVAEALERAKESESITPSDPAPSGERK